MPELPEVETTRRGLLPHLVGRRVRAVVVRQPQLRWPVAAELVAQLPGQRIEAVERRAKYLLVHTRVGSALLHLGMSGSLRVLPERTPAGPHDHVDWRLDDHRLLRLTDPRRFGCELWQAPGTVHELLRGLGPEPLGEDFDGDVLWLRSRGRRSAVKVFIMDQAVVVGVGNIYASEALFVAGIAPRRPAGQVSRERYLRLARAIQQVLLQAIECGGTTLRDFGAPDGARGYFVQELAVYGRAGQPCRNCGTTIRHCVLGGRATYYCPRCQR
ncbi:bifunctional DNA-formamidopyrimidine glycosylase/DNA-(apurinic or apyrimidinic site) lyase [Dokdonella sp.]|uniref:bifunctional DNA-formamidopyrimidine glycosylase/DNA-(apurinic or apyrimidinic site) lyase n=1 Tax=Dokdonella sp. TaxID=2291710 RepID=UPI0027B96681|nr:bifunctional DNA-formamidopyrimidine glycosylase/DNA-(apurinic or apyrimidinic site) lyase [Dokdonella sp.]